VFAKKFTLPLTVIAPLLPVKFMVELAVPLTVPIFKSPQVNVELPEECVQVPFVILKLPVMLILLGTFTDCVKVLVEL